VGERRGAGRLPRGADRAIDHRPVRVALWVLLVLYAGWIVGMTVFPIPLHAAPVPGVTRSYSMNLVPFRTIAAQLRQFDSWSIRQLGGNLLLFVGLGLLALLAVPRLRRLSRVVLAGLAFSAAIEFSQLAVSLALGFPYRVLDVDDVILNVAGVAMGYALFVLVPGERDRTAARRL
jgi:glycopeptide antibiotics resistance protein